MNEGWKCPECGRCYAPWVKSCEAVDCGVTIATAPTEPVCEHAWASDSGGTYCIKCGLRTTTYWPNTWGDSSVIENINTGMRGRAGETQDSGGTGS